MSRRLLVVATAPDPADELLDRLSREAGEDVEVAVVAPVSDVSFVEWAAGDETRAREEAERRAREAAEVEALAARVVDVTVGDPNPVLAVEDALRKFPADELIVVTRPKDATTWLERLALSGELERFGLPVTHLVDDDVDRAERQLAPLSPADRAVAFVLRNLVLTLAVCVGVLIAITLSLYLTAG